MAEKEFKNDPKDLIEAVPEELEKVEPILPTGRNYRKRERKTEEERTKEALDSWVPKTELGKAVRTGKEKDINKVLEQGKKILEPEIVDTLLNIKTDLISIGQAKGKFGGGKRRAWRQTQRKTGEGNVLSFSAMAVVGDERGYIGIGYGKASETLPSREKALRNAKINVQKIFLGYESPENEPENAVPHTVPFKVEGKSGSSRITLWPAPRGTGLVVSDECKKILKLAGIKDVYSKTEGKTKTTFNVAKACVNALEKTKTGFQK